MKHVTATPYDPLDTLDTLPRMPLWVTSGRGHPPEDAAFLSGAALATLHTMSAHADAPHTLLRARLALLAAQACVTHAGRPERAADLRDAVHLLRPGDAPGPAGEIYQTWQRAITQPVTLKALNKAFPIQDPHQIARWLDAGRGGSPINHAASVLERVQADAPHTPEVALILADAALAQAMGWARLVPLLGLSLTARDLYKTGDALRLACHRSVVASAKTAVQTGHDLARKAALLRAVTPKLRAKGAAQAVALFLHSDAVAPSLAMTGFMSDRAARRLCDRLVAFAVVRELTGRDTFRLYGV